MAAAAYADILTAILSQHGQHNPGHGAIESLTVFDHEQQRYSLASVGWNQGRRVHAMIFMARIVDGKIRLEWDGIHYGITEELIAAGVPEEDIVHAWREECPAKAAAPRRRPDAVPVGAH